MSETPSEPSDDWMNFADKPDSSKQENTANIDEVRKVVLDEFDERTWKVMETVLSVHATHLINNIESCFGLIIEGPSGAGKTTALRPFDCVGLSGQFYRSDDITPASFVSHDSSKTDEELEKDDLLPRIKNRTVLNPEMANWFSGDWAVRSEKMSRMVRVMDGDGFTSDSGTHGQRGYTGSYRFNFIGATTPLDKKDWEMMGHTGNRFLFHEMPEPGNKKLDRDAIFGDTEYGEKIDTVQNVVHDFLSQFWVEEHEGPGSVDWPENRNSDIEDKIVYLAKLIQHARSKIRDDGTVEREAIPRIASMLNNLARGHALLYGRNSVKMKDVEVCARVALSTIPRERRKLIRELLQLGIGSGLRTSEVKDRLGVSRPTATKRMKTLETLGIGACYQEKVQGGEATHISVKSEFLWPDELPFPSFY